MPINYEHILKKCRLCQLNSGTAQVIEEEFINKVFECTKIKINIGNLFPKTVCITCKLTIEDFFTYIQKIRLVDLKLHNQITEYEETKSATDDKCFKCPIRPKLYAKYKRDHANLYCISCKATFDDLLGRTNHTCSGLKNDLASDKCERLKANVTELKREVLDVTDSKELKKEWFEDDFPAVKDEKIKSIDKDNQDIHSKEDSNREQPVNQGYVRRKNKLKGCYVCDVCNEKFTSNADLRLHQKIHGKSFSCSYENCSKVCTSAYTLRTHLMRHEGKLPFLCVTCGKGFTTKNSLTSHEKTHAKVKGYVCKECDMGFSVASNLRAHQKKHHEGVRFYCSQCTRAFITKCSLERHELVHTGVKEFKCETCQAAFYTNKELVKHQRYHQGLRSYKCDQCFKTFFEKHHLTIHIRVHTGERPYVCKATGCGKSFTESQKLSRHMRARHPPVQ